MAKKKEQEAEQELDFEGALSDLEAIVRRLEQGNQPLEQALAEYALAIKLIKTCHVRLEVAERKIEILSGIDANGNPTTRPVDDDELSLEDKQEQRDSRRSVPRNQRRHDKPIDDDGSLF